jgi:transcriptional regulator GlxA family with amidase domain
MNRVSQTAASEPRVQNLIRIAESRPRFGVKELAAEANLTRSRLEQFFKQETGVQIGRYLMNLRLRKAVHLLETTDMRIKEITFAVGYEHPSSFVRAFRRSHAISPGSYRKSTTYSSRMARLGVSFGSNEAPGPTAAEVAFAPD